MMKKHEVESTKVAAHLNQLRDSSRKSAKCHQNPPGQMRCVTILTRLCGCSVDLQTYIHFSLTGQTALSAILGILRSSWNKTAPLK